MNAGLHISEDGDGEEPRTYQVALQLVSKDTVGGSRKMLQSFVSRFFVALSSGRCFCRSEAAFL